MEKGETQGRAWDNVSAVRLSSSCLLLSVRPRTGAVVHTILLVFQVIPRGLPFPGRTDTPLLTSTRIKALT